MHADARALRISRPPLCDEAAVEIHNFLEELLDLFETEYGRQIERYYVQRSQAHIIEPTPPPPTDDPPF